MEEIKNVTEGYIYIIFNEWFSIEGSNVYKLGRTSDIHKRIGCYSTNFIKPREIIFLSEQCKNCPLAEKVFFKRLDDFRICKRKEFFKVDKQQAINVIINVIEGVNDDTITELEIRNLNNWAPIREMKNPETDHTRILALLTNNEHLKTGFDNINGRVISDKTLRQVKLIRQIETTYGIDLLTPNFFKKGDIVMTEDMYNEIKKLFETKKLKPVTYRELNILYVCCVKHLTVKGMIISTQIKKTMGGNRDKMSYTLNKNLIKQHLLVLESNDFLESPNLSLII